MQARYALTPIAFAVSTLVLLAAADLWATPTSVNVKDCYASVNPTDDDALHKAIAVAQGLLAGFNTACGVPGATLYIGAVYVPPGSYELKTPLVITKALTIVGVRAPRAPAPNGSRIFASTSAPPDKMIHINTDDPVLVTDLTLDADAQEAGDSAIFVEGTVAANRPDATENENLTIERVSIIKAQIGIRLAAASKVTIRTNYIKDFKQVGIDVENAFHVDRGDSLIEGCWIASETSTAVGIDQASSGGLKVIGNKIVGGMQVGYRLLGTAESGMTGGLIIDGNSFEAQSGANIQIIRGDTALVFGVVVISNNQMNSSTTGILIVDGTSSMSPNWLRGVTITGNVLGGHTAAGISLYEADGVFIGSNVFWSSVLGIYLNASTAGGHVIATNVNVGPNTYVGTTTHIANPSVATLCPPSTCN